MKLKKHIAISESGFVIDMTTGESFTVNSVGIEILSHLQKNKSKRYIKNAILLKYDADAKTFEEDFKGFLEELQGMRLIEL